MNSSPPLNAVAACTHADPYPYYAQLVARSPFFFDEALKFWIASSAAAVEAVLGSELCHVRPSSEPVPLALVGSPAADVFRHLIRQNDGPRHCPFKRAVENALRSVDDARIAGRAKHWAEFLIAESSVVPDAHTSYAWINEYSFGLSAFVIGDLLGLRHAALKDVGSWVAEFVRCVFPGSTPLQIEQGKAAAGKLLALFRDEFHSRPVGLFADLFSEAEVVGKVDSHVVIANAIGFLSQAYEATAGLIQNSLLTLATNQGMQKSVFDSPRLLPNLILEVLRYDPPSHNTRRFVARSGNILGQPLKEGDVILVLLAAANRDPAANDRPEECDLLRPDRKLFTFGGGSHACPGDVFATTIAESGVRALLSTGLDLTALRNFTYRPSANTRIPLFG
jgi:cytochrome P450